MVQDVVRGGRLDGERTEDVNWLLSSAEGDRYIADADLLVDLAHVLMLLRQGILGEPEARTLLGGLLSLRDSGLPGSVLDPSFEDIHAGIEAHLTAMVGDEAGGRLHVARSRNDEVATCLRLRLRDELLGAAGDACALRAVLLEVAASHAESVMPGFTHLQHAQPTTLAHHLLAYSGALERDTARLLDCYARTNRSPLGAAALASTGFPVDREWTAARLGFSGILENSMDAVSGRDFALEALSCSAVLTGTLSRLAGELVLWSSPLVGFVVLDDSYCSTSSIMPQKKNPDTLELVRAKASSVSGALAASLGIVRGLPQSYNRDLQELSRHLWRGVDDARRSLRVMAGALRTARFDTGRMAEEAGRGGSTATELADTLAREFGMPFRTAHRVVAGAVRRGRLDLAGIEAEALATAEISLVARGLDQGRVDRALDPLESVRVRGTAGGPAPGAVRSTLGSAGARLERDRAFVIGEQERVRVAIDGLVAAAREAAV
ncbi:MAG: argininosuccinate lyase [Methanospirillum sp.]|nr:argininosuccinate lyase [Methanospirillum sp.]